MKTICYCLLPLLASAFNADDASAQGNPQDNLVHAWTFDDGTARDQVGTADGTLVGDIEITDGALMCTGGWMELPPDVIAINTFDELTVEVLYTPAEDLNTGFTMIAYFGTTTGNVGTDYFFLSSARGDDSSRAAISIGVEANPWEGEDGANGPEYDDGQLHHMVSTLTADTITLYLDGEQTGSTMLQREENTIQGISPDFAYVCRGGYLDDPNWLGFVHEYKIYDRALSEEEVALLYLLATDYDENDGLPEGFVLSQNYPNPFNPLTTIRYSVSQPTHVEISVYDLLGHRMETLVSEQKVAGSHEVVFDGRGLASGVYLYRMIAGSFQDTKRLVLLK